MTQFLTADTQFPPYMICPRFLMDYPMSETTKFLYVLLLDRARISMKKKEWLDEQGHVFLYFTITNMAAMLHKSETTVKYCLSDLEENELILRRRLGTGKPNRIYVKIPSNAPVRTDTSALADQNLSLEQTENCPPDSQKTVSRTDGNLSGNKKERVKTNQKKRESDGALLAYGTYRNVFLTEEQMADLKENVRNYGDYIERLSVYMETHGKSYRNHAATIKSWEARDRAASPSRNYECREDESL
ncbi:MAG: replication initiator protein A [Lachnospiraceae bacterium]|nr:replication initiator protein A [Lachnospiraceae bacterium]